MRVPARDCPQGSANLVQLLQTSYSIQGSAQNGSFFDEGRELLKTYGENDSKSIEQLRVSVKSFTSSYRVALQSKC